MVPMIFGNPNGRIVVNAGGGAEVMPPPINTEFMEWDVQLSHDGRRMFFSSDRHFSWGDLDIWYSDWNDSTQSWGEPVNLGLGANSSGDDYGAYPSIDGSLLYFCSWNPHGFSRPRWLGPVDLFIAFNRGNGWDSVDILPPPIMTGYWEESPAISDDGMTIYFSSSRPGGPGAPDIFVSHNITAIEEDDSGIQPGATTISAFPNPFNSSTVISITNAQHADIAIFDIQGRKITTLQTENGKAIWNAAGYSSGIYFAGVTDTPTKGQTGTSAAQIAGSARTIKLVLLK
jgi:hypothetical protein